MHFFTISDYLLYGGFGAMLTALVTAIAATVFFVIKRKRLNKKLEQEYGKPLK